MQSFRTELENPIVEKDVKAKYMMKSLEACAWQEEFTDKGNLVYKWYALNCHLGR